ncbi:acyl-CoA dehydrogenase [Janthinobacterium sp. AD80]|uniref:acyl-CoA dehydrogenase n=1 Tax=Janthinobacterium sp. AD80 TaxID=1528773 RepID=UPI000CB6AE91|nr:acyl-CoA dehydrogenase [Janthinobacterium sp. AD80]PMQ17201.1 Acyl-coenzyme A dehydrogenase [Janthinobacterium sp. AD80]
MLTIILLVALLGLLILFVVGPVRRALITPRLLALFKRILPSMSDTERDALEAGTTWWDAELFSGKPDWAKLLAYAPPTLSAEERHFLDHDVERLCELVNDWDTQQLLDLPPPAWAYMKSQGFLGMIIPKQYGGKQFSAYMHSQVVMKLSTRCSALAVSVMVPNSLGPAELLLHYGTEAQKDYYLPRLAAGTEIPCFALTSPYAGSDAAAIPDLGVVCMGMHEGKSTLGLRITWNKRYITLAPVATLLGLAFQTSDPEHLLSDDDTPGITCALIPASHDGVVIGRRHHPLNAVFQNGPTSGKDVFIPMEWVIGGQAQVGKGWRMLMECLAAGRAISLPSSSVGMGKMAVRGTSAYAAVRRQFNMPIGKFEGVQEALARMGANLYLMDAARTLSAVGVDLGEKPAVISAIVKYHVTERGRALVNDGMDILGGKGICSGPNNFLATAYQQIPIAITVEGANILTRSLIIFGQGAIRAHPYVLREMAAVKESDGRKALHDFDSAFFGHVGFVLGNLARGLWYGLGGARLAAVPQAGAPELAAYYRALTRLSTAFAVMTDMSMFVLGGELKRRERLSARLGDVVSQLYLCSSVLKRYEDDGRPPADLPYVHWSLQDALVKAQQGLAGVLENFPARGLAVLLRTVLFPFGLPHRPPSDQLGSDVTHAMQTAGADRERLLADCYVESEGSQGGDPLASAERALMLLPQVVAIEKRLKDANADLKHMPQSLSAMQTWLSAAKAAGAISCPEHNTLLEFARLVDGLIQVDDFAPTAAQAMPDAYPRDDAGVVEASGKPSTSGTSATYTTMTESQTAPGQYALTPK